MTYYLNQFFGKNGYMVIYGATLPLVYKVVTSTFESLSSKGIGIKILLIFVFGMIEITPFIYIRHKLTFQAFQFHDHVPSHDMIYRPSKYSLCLL